jgi:protein ImuB
MPVAALRIARPVVEALSRVGIGTVGHLLRIPRATIPNRFGPDVMKRLDQALGTLREPINPVLPPTAKRQHISFAEPIGTPEDLARVAALLTERLCRDLEIAHEGARRLDLLFQRSDGQTEAIRVGTSKPSRDAKHLVKLFVEKLGMVDPGHGIDAATLTAWRTEVLVPEQVNTLGDVEIDRRELAQLTDKLANRLGHGNVYRMAPVESDIPERAMRRVSGAAEVAGDWPKEAERPLSLLTPPEPVDVTAMLPDHPPVMFQWRGKLHRVKRADGPERIFGEWWQQPGEIAEVRDYFRVENERGERYWLYRDSRLTVGNTYRWYLHGVFA